MQVGASGQRDLQKYMSRNGIKGGVRRTSLGMMNALIEVGFKPNHCAWWLQWDSPEGERVFADCFFEPGVARLLWKDIGSQETAEQILKEIDQLGIPAHFLFPSRFSDNPAPPMSNFAHTVQP